MKTFYDYFNIEYGQREYHSKSFLSKYPGDIPLISSKGIDNGIYGYFDIKPRYCNIITVPSTGSIGIAFYQNFKCCVDDNCLVLTPKMKLQDVEMLYFTLLVRQNKYRFVYGRQITPDRLGNISIPSTLPQWLKDVNIADTSKLKEPYWKKSIELNEEKWRWFVYDDLFEIERGKGPRKNQLNGTGDTPFVTSSDQNNGWTDFTDAAPAHNGNTIGVNRNGSVAEAFYQPFPFCSTEDVHIFTPKFDINKYVALFLVTLIKKEKYRYNYGRKWGIARMRTSTIKLPVDKSGQPDWKLMEDYIKTINYSKNI